MVDHLGSVGQTILESLARRFRVPLSHDRGVMGWIGETELGVSCKKGKGKAKDDPAAMPKTSERVTITLLKPSAYDPSESSDGDF